MRAYFSLVGAGLLAALVCGAALCWDGSVYLFQILDLQRPFIPHNRLINLVLQWPVLLLSHLTSDIGVLQVVFGLSYIVVPLIGLWLCWRIVRDSDPRLFVWPALGLGLGNLPGQLNFVAESAVAISLFWPVAMAILVGLPARWRPLVIALTLIVGFTHPNAVLLFAGATALALVLSIRRPGQTPALWSWTALFALFTVATFVRLTFFQSSYEADALTPGLLAWTIGVSLGGAPIKALALVWVAAALILAAIPVARRRRPEWLLGIYLMELAVLAAAGLILLIWAINPDLWRWANKFTNPAPFITLSFIGLAGLDVLLRRRTGEEGPVVAALEWSHRRRVAQVTGVVFCLVLTTQSLAWSGLTHRLRETISVSRAACISAAPISWLERTSLNQFALPHLAILLQGRAPEKLVLNDDQCGVLAPSDGVQLTEFSFRGWEGGWFDLRTVGPRLVEQHSQTDHCTFTLTTGWHRTEADEYAWWRWSDGRDARLRVLSDSETTLILEGRIESAQRPNRIRVVVNGDRVATLEISALGMRRFGPLPLPVAAGVNEIQLVSDNSPTPTGTREQAIAVSNLTLTPPSLHTPCERMA